MDSVIQFEGTIYEDGYGLIAQKAMRDKSLPKQSKLIYAYMCSFASVGKNGERTAFPPVSLQCAELQMTEDTYYKWRKPLIDKGYLKITKRRKEGAKFDNNIYSIMAVPVPIEVINEKKEPYPKNSGKEPYPNFSCTEKSSTEKSGTNSISFNSIIFNNKEKEEEEEKLTQISNLTEFFFQNISKSGKDVVKDKLAEWMNKMPYDVIKAELEHCALHGAKSWKFVDTCLKKLEAANITTVEQQQQFHADYQNKSNEKRQKPVNNRQSRKGRTEILPDFWDKDSQAESDNQNSSEDLEQKREELHKRLAAFRSK